MRISKDYIIPLIIFSFICVGLLAWAASSGNQPCMWTLEILGGVFMFGVFVLFPAAAFTSITHNQEIPRKPFIAFIFSFIVLWGLVFFIVEIQPELGWDYVKFFNKYLFPMIRILRKLLPGGSHGGQ